MKQNETRFCSCSYLEFYEKLVSSFHYRTGFNKRLHAGIFKARWEKNSGWEGERGAVARHGPRWMDVAGTLYAAALGRCRPPGRDPQQNTGSDRRGKNKGIL